MNSFFQIINSLIDSFGVSLNWLAVNIGFFISFSFIYNANSYRQTHPQLVQQPSVVLTSYAYSRVPKYKYRKTNMDVHKGWAFLRGIYSEIHTGNYLFIIALTLQPIRGCPQHSGETGNNFSWGRWDVCRQATEKSFSVRELVQKWPWTGTYRLEIVLFWGKMGLIMTTNTQKSIWDGRFRDTFWRSVLYLVDALHIFRAGGTQWFYIRDLKIPYRRRPWKWLSFFFLQLLQIA